MASMLLARSRAIAAWFLTDAAFININEYFYRDEFEAELRALVDEDRTKIEQRITETLRQKGQQLDEEIAEDFRLSGLADDREE